MYQNIAPKDMNKSQVSKILYCNFWSNSDFLLCEIEHLPADFYYTGVNVINNFRSPKVSFLRLIYETRVGTPVDRMCAHFNLARMCLMFVLFHSC